MWYNRIVLIEMWKILNLSRNFCKFHVILGAEIISNTFFDEFF